MQNKYPKISIVGNKKNLLATVDKNKIIINGNDGTEYFISVKSVGCVVIDLKSYFIDFDFIPEVWEGGGVRGLRVEVGTFKLLNPSARALIDILTKKPNRFTSYINTENQIMLI